MPTATAPEADPVDIDDRLDQLIPPTPSIAKRFLAGLSILLLAIVAAFLIGSGRLHPRPTSGVSWSSGFPLALDEDDGVFIGLVDMPNNSSRTVRITEITLDAPGASLVDVGVRIEPASLGADSSTGPTEEEAMPDVVNAERNDLTGEPNQPLPIEIGPGEWANLFLRIRPDSCTNIVDPVGDWGIASVTVDFGDGAFPPVSRTIRLDPDPIVDEGAPASFVEFVGPDGFDTNFISAEAGVLTTACEALR